MKKEEAIKKIGDTFGDPKVILNMLESTESAKQVAAAQAIYRAFVKDTANEIYAALTGKNVEANNNESTDSKIVTDAVEKAEKKLIKKMKNFLESEAFCEDGNYVSTYFKTKKELIKEFNKIIKA